MMRNACAYKRNFIGACASKTSIYVPIKRLKLYKLAYRRCAYLRGNRVKPDQLDLRQLKVTFFFLNAITN